METNKIYNANCLEFLKTIENNSIDIIFTDPPYNLSTEWIIKENGKPDVKGLAKDFMLKWEGLDGEKLELLFAEYFRILKYGGRVLMFGIDRQSWVNAYYGQYAGFQKQMSIYWYYISSFPKATDLSKIIDKNAGCERDEVIGTGSSGGMVSLSKSRVEHGYRKNETTAKSNFDLLAPKTDLAKKYDGYKYSVCPLKQCVEEIAVFQKPYKTGSCLHDTLAYENGDNECLCGALNIDAGRVPTNDCWENSADDIRANNYIKGEKKTHPTLIKHSHELGRYPAQTFIDSGIANKLDEQSGVKKSNGHFNSKVTGMGETIYKGGFKDFQQDDRQLSDVGGVSKILHKCDYDKEDFDLYIYCPKVAEEERNLGCGNIEAKAISGESEEWGKMGINSPKYREGRGVSSEIPKSSNSHPTVKPIFLLRKVLQLFKTPNPQIILDTFGGSGSTAIACIKEKMDFILIEQNPEFCEIAEARIKHYTDQPELF